MAAQHARIEETIVNMKRARARNDDRYDAEFPIDHPSNRGNKLKLHAEYVQEGRLWNGDGPSVRTEKINHAGYDRSIIYRKPQRYDEDGDLIFEDDLDDEDAELSPAEDDIYAEIKLEEILGPLTAASDLPSHPGMAPAYTSKALDEMIEKVSQILRRELDSLVKLKNLLTSLRGDEQWAPCGYFNTDYDESLLQGHSLGNFDQMQSTSHGQIHDTTVSGTHPTSVAVTVTDGTNPDADNDVEMADGNAQNGVNGLPEAVSAALATAAEHNGHALLGEGDGAFKATLSVGGEVVDEEKAKKNGDPKKNVIDGASATGAGDEGEDNDAASVQMSHRMTTRAQASKQSDQSSQMSDDGDIPPIHPIFMFPPSAQSDADFGLPPSEGERLRSFLGLHVARQEEIVRSMIELQSGLLKANRMRKNVFKWAKAEGHLGEMSDGEDWYDMDEWGLKEPLKKGEEEPDEEANVPGKKTRQRRAER